MLNWDEWSNSRTMSCRAKGDAIKYEDIKILVHVQERELISDQKISYPTNQINTAAAFRPF